MNEMGLRPDRGYVKCARVVGEVMGKLHPHGDASIYDALVRMAQPFSMRLPRAGVADDLAAGREVGAFDDVQELIEADVVVVDHRQAGVDDFAEVVGRDVGRHAHGDAA